jgi:hypothetical protein
VGAADPLAALRKSLQHQVAEMPSVLIAQHKNPASPNNRIFAGSGKRRNLKAGNYHPLWSLPSEPHRQYDMYFATAATRSKPIPLSVLRATFNFLKDRFPLTGSNFKEFQKNRQDLLGQNPIQLIYASFASYQNSNPQCKSVTDCALDEHDFRAETWVNRNYPANANPWHIAQGNQTNALPPHERGKSHSTKAVTRLTSIQEAVNLVLRAAQGKPVTDLILAAYGLPNTLMFGNAQGRLIVVNLNSKETLRHLARLKTVLKPGAQIYINACNVAAGTGAATVQKIAKLFPGVAVYATRQADRFAYPVSSEIDMYYQTMK